MNAAIFSLFNQMVDARKGGQQTLDEIEQAFQNKHQQLGVVKARIPVKEMQFLRIIGGDSFHNL